MDRAKVILHMETSIDGKIEGYFADAPLTGQVGSVYYDLIPKLGDASGGGSYTACLYSATASPDFGKYKDADVPEGDFIVPAPEGKYHFVFDRYGKCNWDTDENEGGKVVEVLTRQVRKEFLAYLREQKISYIFAGEKDLEVEHALEKIKSLFKVDTLVLCGGATINGVFLKAGMVDGISQVIVPYVEGNHEQKGTAETDVFVPQAFLLKSATPIHDGGVHLIWERK